MTVVSPPEQEHLLSTLQQRFSTFATDKYRSKAWERFLQMGLPTRKQEVFQYVPLRRLFENEFQTPESLNIAPALFESHVLPECRHSHIVLVNGRYDPALSDFSDLDSSAIVSTFQDAQQSFGAFLSNFWTHSIKDETDAFATLNNALHEEGVFIYLPPKCQVTVPLQIIHVVSGKQGISFPRIQVVASKESSLSLICTTIETASGAYMVSGVVDFTLEDNAHINFVQSFPELAADSWHFNALRAKLKKHAHLHAVSFSNGARTVRNDYRVTLTGEGADASLSDLWMLSDKREAHANVLIEHQAPNCRSQQLFKGVLAGISRSSFEGKILVQRPAQKTEAYQLNNHLLLSDQANADSKPNLEIFADDVKASHGATMGQLDSEQLFYLKARGLSDSESKNLLINGFAREIIDLIKVNSLGERLLTQVRAFLS